MNSIKSLTILFILFFASSIYAQKVMYNGKFYTIVNSKIFHRGYNVDGKLTDGSIDSIKVIGKELYNEKGKLKTEYKKRHIRQRYTLPEEFWATNTVIAATSASVQNTANTSNQVSTKNPNVIAATSGAALIMASDSLKTEEVKSVQPDEVVQVEKEKLDRLNEESTQNKQETTKQQAASEKRESVKEKEVKTEKKEQTKNTAKETENTVQSKSTTKKTTQNQQATSEKHKTEKKVKTETKEKTKKTTKQTKNTVQSKSTTKKTTSKSAKKQKKGNKKVKISPVEAAAGVLIIKSSKGKKAPKKTMYQLYFDKC